MPPRRKFEKGMAIWATYSSPLPVDFFFGVFVAVFVVLRLAVAGAQVHRPQVQIGDLQRSQIGSPVVSGAPQPVRRQRLQCLEKSSSGYGGTSVRSASAKNCTPLAA